jgi:flagellin
VDNASFNGVNMLKGNGVNDAGTSVKALANAKATGAIEVAGVNFQLLEPLTAAVADTASTALQDESRIAGDAAITYGSHTGINLGLGNRVFTGQGAFTDAAGGADNAATLDYDESGAISLTGGERDAARAKAIVGHIDTAIAFVSEKLTALGTGSKALSSHLSFMSKLQDSLDAGVGDLVDADLAKESARLQALQTKQQLGIQALSIANSSSSTLLGLFR